MSDDEKAQANLDKIIEKFGYVAGGQWTMILNKNLAAAAMARVQQQFRKSVDPYDKEWAPLKIRKGKPLRDTGRLASSFTYTSDRDGFKIGTNWKHVLTHQQGATIEPTKAKALRFPVGSFKSKGKKTTKFAFAFSVHVPQRMMIPEGAWPPPWQTAMKEASEIAFEKFWEKLEGSKV